MKVNLSKQPITAEALENRLRAAKLKAAGVHAHLSDAVTDFRQTHSGAELQIFLREVDVLDNLLDMALRYAESLGKQVSQETERIAAEDETIWGVSPEEFARQLGEDQK